jgi:hypothetical protein
MSVDIKKNKNDLNLNPLTIARSQLLTAIDIFFADGDPISVHTLAGASREILESLCRLDGIEPMTDFILKDHPTKSKKDIWAALNLYRNCFKHVGKTSEEREADQATLDQFDDTHNEFLLYVCVEDYVRLRKAMPVKYQVLQAWFAALHLNLLVDAAHSRSFQQAFPLIDKMHRPEQKRRGREMIRLMESDAILLSDPRTEAL